MTQSEEYSFHDVLGIRRRVTELANDDAKYKASCAQTGATVRGNISYTFNVRKDDKDFGQFNMSEVAGEISHAISIKEGQTPRYDDDGEITHEAYQGIQARITTGLKKGLDPAFKLSEFRGSYSGHGIIILRDSRQNEAENPATKLKIVVALGEEDKDKIDEDQLRKFVLAELVRISDDSANYSGWIEHSPLVQSPQIDFSYGQPIATERHQRGIST